MGEVLKLIVWMASWLLGCIVFDHALHLHGPWLMLGGAVTYIVCDTLTQRLPTNGGAGAV